MLAVFDETLSTIIVVGCHDDVAMVTPMLYIIGSVLFGKDFAIDLGQLYGAKDSPQFLVTFDLKYCFISYIHGRCFMMLNKVSGIEEVSNWAIAFTCKTNFHISVIIVAVCLRIQVKHTIASRHY
jgi:hypothetical protein